MSTVSHKKGSKLHGKSLEQRRSALKAADAKEIVELTKRIAQETPPKGSNPLSLDRPSDSFTPGSADAADESAAGASTPAAAASSGESTPRNSNKAAKQAARANAGGSVIYGAVRKFAELPISARTLQALTDASFTRLTDIQRAAIPHALAGRDILGAARTGSGKTLAYLVPVLERLYRERWGKLDGVGALIIVPTRELAMQIFDVLRSSVGKTHNYSAGLIIGGKDLAEEQERIGGMNILICTPGRILQHFEQTYGFQCDNLQMLVLDEADRILDLGFSQAMSDIISYLPKQRQTLLFSATQTRNLKELAKLSLREPEYIAVHESATTALPNKLVQHYTIISADQKINLLYSYIKTHLQVKSIVFLSSGKQKMKQAKRMSIYYDFCAKSCALLFCTDLAARGLDFPEVDWVVQMDAPENTATYIHRVGRTARYRSGGKSLLFLLPSELAFISALLDSKKVSEIKKVKADASKMKDVTSQFSAFLAENTELKFLAQKAFVSYVRSVSLQTDKAVFKAEEIPFDALAKSMGLIGTPKVKLPKSSAAAASSASHREKNMPHQLRELLAEKKEGSAAALAKQARKEARKAAALGLPVQPQTAVDKILSRKNATVFSEARSKLRARDDDDEESEDDMMVVRRRDHDLSDDDDDEGVELSSESDAASAADDDDEEGAAVPKPNKAAVRAELEKRMAARGAEIETRGLDSASTSAAFLAEARQRVQEHDPADRRAEHERVRAKHVAQKIAAKRHKRESEREKAEAGAHGGDESEDDGVVVTLGRPDGEDDDEADGAEAMEDDDDQSQQDGSAAEEEESADEDAPAAAAAGSKRKGAAAASSSSARAAKQSAAKKQRTAAPSSLADQEALALKILGQQR